MRDAKEVQQAERPLPQQPGFVEDLQASILIYWQLPTCRWLNPVLVGQFELVEWTPEGHLRHSRLVALRDDMERGRCGGSNAGT